ncbi:MAG TPA: C40 family peptidase, partial [Streptosporangiaceae bacterium]|nr:C40 family peptidase [Streptosporangiaceae bacterium]
VVAAPTVLADVAGERLPVRVSYGTRVYSPVPAGDGPARGTDIVRSATGFAGLDYLWGGTTGFGLDCSGLAWLVLRRHGILAPRDAHDQAEAGQPVRLDALTAGDLVFFAEQPAGRIHHVGLALGDGRMVYSPRTGRPVEVTALAAEPYATELVSARRYR